MTAGDSLDAPGGPDGTNGAPSDGDGGFSARRRSAALALEISGSEAAVAAGGKLDTGDLEAFKYIDASCVDLVGGIEPDEGDAHRHGTWLTASLDVITAVIGVGVLSLPFSVSWLGWVGGMAMMLLFAWITQYTSALLVDAMVIRGKRQRTYVGAVKTVFGRGGSLWLGFFQYINLVFTCIAFTITSAQSIQSIVTLVNPNAFNKLCVWSAVYGGAELFLSQLPNMDSVWWASAVGATCSTVYSLITLGLSIDTAAENDSLYGTVGGRSGTSSADKAFNICNSLGAIVFAYSFSFILIEIADTVRTDVPGGPVRAVKKAVNVSLAWITIFFTAVAAVGYMAFGNDVCGNILTCFTTPKWLLVTTHSLVLLHMLPAFQLFAQPVFALIESWVDGRLQQRQQQKSPGGGGYACGGGAWAARALAPLPLRLWWRSAYVLLMTFLAIMMPFFNDIVGLVGALGFWPATVLFPVEMYRVLYRPPLRTLLWLEAINLFCFLATLAAVIGSIQQIAVNASTYDFFG